MDASFSEWELQRFAGTLRAPEDYCQLGLKQCRKLIDRISTELINGEEDDNYFEVHSSHIGGTLARETDVLVPEFDLIIYVAVAESKREEEELFNLPYFFGVAVEILKENQHDLKIIPGSIGVFEGSTIRFMFQHGITVNLWPFPYEEQNSKTGHLAEHIKTVQALEAREQFMRDQSPFAHELIRLVKFWVQSKGPFHLGEAEFTTTKILRMVELICVAVSMDVEGKHQKQNSVLMQMNGRHQNGGVLEHPPNMFQAFGKVFELLGDLESMKLMFRKIEDEKWNPTKPSSRIKRGVTLKKVRSGKWERYPERSLQMMPTFSNLKCFIMDPANSNYNVLQDFDQSGIDRLTTFGKQSLGCLAKYRNHHYTIKYNGRTVMQFDEFFEPALPKNIFFPKEYSVDFVDSYPTMFISLDVQNQGLFTANPKIRSFTNLMKDNLQFMVKSVLEQGLSWGEIRSTLERAVRRYRKLYIPPKMKLIEEEMSERDHSSFDVIIYVPFGSDEEKGKDLTRPSLQALRFGMSWRM